MKKGLWMTCVLLTLPAGIAAAAGGGINLGWGDCGGLPATENRQFACDTNSGINTLVGSYVAPCCVTAMTGNEITMDMQSTGTTLPPWWQFTNFQTPLCRPNSLRWSSDFLTVGPYTCVDYWQNEAAGGIQERFSAGNRARIVVVVALPSGSPVVGPVPEGQETYSYKCIINNLSTTGLGACGGCGASACIVLNSIKIHQVNDNPYDPLIITAPAGRNWVTWQGGIGTDCFLATPARNVTWGSIKTLYK